MSQILAARVVALRQGASAIRGTVQRCRASLGRSRGLWVRSAAAADGSAALPTETAGRSVTSATPERAGKQQMIDLQPPRGTRDFPPEDMRLRKWLFGKFAEVIVSIPTKSVDVNIIITNVIIISKYCA